MPTDAVHLMMKEKPSVTVIGDVILDVFTDAQTERTSSEANVPIMVMRNESKMPGGAGNVATNIAALGGRPKLISVIGAGYSGSELTELLKQAKVDTTDLIIDQQRSTTIKTRILHDGNPYVCLAHETRRPVDQWVIDRIIERLLTSESSVLVISDYNRGMISSELIRRILTEGQAKDWKVISDVHPREGFDLQAQQGSFLLTPNRFEAMQMLGLPRVPPEGDDMAEKIALSLAERYESNILLTRDSEGMTLCTMDGNISHIPAKVKSALSVSGAGDTVVATIAMALASGIDLHKASELSAYAASVVVAKPGTSTVSHTELLHAIKHNGGIPNTGS